MLIQTITFQIHDFKNNTTDEYLVANTEENQEQIFCHRYTRNIKFGQMFSFQYDKEMRMPVDFISMATWMNLVNANPELVAIDLPVADLTDA